MADFRNGIFCIEGDWDKDKRRQSSVRSVLDLMKNYDHKIPTQHRSTVTPDSLKELFRMASARARNGLPIIYLAVHGRKNAVFAGDRKSDIVTLDEIEEWNDDFRQRNKHGRGLFDRRIVFFASCKTVNVDARNLKRFVRNTGALAVCGYKTDVDWMYATVFETSLFYEFCDKDLSVKDRRNLRRVNRNIDEAFAELRERQPALWKELGFRYVINDHTGGRA